MQRSLASTFRGFVVLLGGSVVGQALGFVALAFASRRLGASALGAYAYAYALVGYFSIIPGGIQYFAKREAAGDYDRRSEAYLETIVLQAGVCVVSLAVLLPLRHVLSGSEQAAQMIAITSLLLPIGVVTFDWVLLVERRRVWVTVARILGQLVYAACVPLLVLNVSDLRVYALVSVSGVAVTAAIMLPAWREVNLRQIVHLRARALLTRLKKSLAITYSLAMMQFYAVGGITVLGMVSTDHEVGLLSVASRLPSVLLVAANVWMQAFLPDLVDQYTRNPENLRRSVVTILEAAFTLAVVISALAAITARPLMVALFGADFAAASTPFALMTVAMSLVLIEAVTSNVLITTLQERRYALIVTGAAVVNIGLCLAMAPPFGATGAAIASVVTEAFLTVGTYIWAQQILGSLRPNRPRVLRGLLASGAAAAAALLTHGLGLVIAIAAGAITFITLALLLKVFDPALWRSRSGNPQ